MGDSTVNTVKSVWEAVWTFYLGSCALSWTDLSCKMRVAVRQGRSSRVWRSSTAVPAVTREGSRSTKSSASAGLSHANSYRDRQVESRQLVKPTRRCSGHATVSLCGRVFTFSRFGKKRVYCGTRSCRLSRFRRRKRSSSCARKWSLNSSAGNRPNTRFHTISQSTAAISPRRFRVLLMVANQFFSYLLQTLNPTCLNPHLSMRSCTHRG